MNQKNYITNIGFLKLRKELDDLLRVERPQVTKTVAWAASNGDRSENADYIYGKKRLREIDKRSRFLSSRLENAVVIYPENIKSEKVQFGATVMILDDEGTEKTFSIVGVDELNSEKNHISWKSPIGSSLIGKEVGDTISVITPNGLRNFELVNIIYKKLE